MVVVPLMVLSSGRVHWWFLDHWSFSGQSMILTTSLIASHPFNFESILVTKYTIKVCWEFIQLTILHKSKYYMRFIWKNVLISRRPKMFTFSCVAKSWYAEVPFNKLLTSFSNRTKLAVPVSSWTRHWIRNLMKGLMNMCK